MYYVPRAGAARIRVHVYILPYTRKVCAALIQITCRGDISFTCEVGSTSSCSWKRSYALPVEYVLCMAVQACSLCASYQRYGGTWRRHVAGVCTCMLAAHPAFRRPANSPAPRSSLCLRVQIISLHTAYVPESDSKKHSPSAFPCIVRIVLCFLVQWYGTCQGPPRPSVSLGRRHTDRQKNL